MQKFKKIPKFKTTTEETLFWEKHDSTQYIDWNQAKHVIFPNLKPSTETISLRLPENLLNEIKVLANKQDVPYQSLMKIFLAEGIHSHRNHTI
jgi:predicted DNA binding CopG/RHH family protein